MAKGTDERRQDPWPFSTKLVDEEGEEDDRAAGFDNAIDSSPESDVGEAYGSEDCGRVVVYGCSAGPCC